jgi:Zn-dependent protease with chaperone function
MVPLSLLVLPAVVFVAFLLPRILPRLLGARELPPGELREALFALAARRGVKLRSVCTWPAARNSGRARINALALGALGFCGRPAILFTEALLAALPPEEVLAVCSHEVEHLRRRHAVLPLALAAGLVLGVDAALLGAGDDGGAAGSILALLQVFAAAGALVLLRRRLEHEADLGAAQAVGGDAVLNALDRLESEGSRRWGFPFFHPSTQARRRTLSLLVTSERTHAEFRRAGLLWRVGLGLWATLSALALAAVTLA